MLINNLNFMIQYFATLLNIFPVKLASISEILTFILSIKNLNHKASNTASSAPWLIVFKNCQTMMERFIEE